MMVQSGVVRSFSTYSIFPWCSSDLLGIRPSPNNGTHGSLNHLLKHPVYPPVHPAQLSHDSHCEASASVPAYSLQCNCSSQSPEMVCSRHTPLICPALQISCLEALVGCWGAKILCAILATLIKTFSSFSKTCSDLWFLQHLYFFRIFTFVYKYFLH